MQMICALLIFQCTTFDQPLDSISPWLDAQTRNLDDVIADLEAQQHRRFIKTHVPLDGLPFHSEIAYICVGRDPRDVAISWANHVDNANVDAFFDARARAVGLDDLAEIYGDSAPAVPHGADAVGQFWAWVDDVTPIELTPSNLALTMHHLTTFWDARDRPNVTFVHYADLQHDLPGEMGRLAHRLGIDVREASFPDLVAAARFEAMRDRADELAPDSSQGLWRTNRQFFNTGRTGQWQTVLANHDDQRRYAARVRELAPPDLVEWAHHGPLDDAPNG
jgi:hypothetical protein